MKSREPGQRYNVIGFDADDTLWHNLSVFTRTEKRFRRLLTRYHEEDWIAQRLTETESRNLDLFGYGVKGFTLSMIETAIELTEGRVSGSEVQSIIDLAKGMLREPVELLDHVESTLAELSQGHTLMVITKGDLFDQETKIARSGLGDFFARVEVVVEKDVDAYRRVFVKFDIDPSRFLMVGNSLRSDVLPALAAGADAVHVPYHTTWVNEQADDEQVAAADFQTIRHLGELTPLLRGQATSG